MRIRHGDLALIGIDSLPEGLKKSDSKVLMTGSGGNDHTFDNGRLYKPDRQDAFIAGYFEAFENSKLYHPEHGRKKGNKLRQVKIPAGLYELRRQVEDTHVGMRKVVD